MDGLVGGYLALQSVQEPDEFLMPPLVVCKQATAGQWWRCIFCPLTVPSSTLSAANSVVVPLRL